MTAGRWALRAIGGLAVAKAAFSAFGLLAWITGWASPVGAVPWTNAGLLLSFLASALWLMLGSSDARAHALGVTYALVAAAFSDRILIDLAAIPFGQPIGSILVMLQCAAWIPLGVSSFFRDFPRVATGSGAPGWWWPTGLFLLGAGLFLADAILRMGVSGPLEPMLRHVGSGVPNSWFWPLVLTPPAIELTLAVRRRRLAPTDERRRVESLLWALVIGVTPLLVAVVLSELIPSLRAFIVEPGHYPWFQAAVLVPLASIPFATAYAIQIHQALDVRRIARQAAQYALARYTLITLISLPLVLIIAVIYRNRNHRVADLLTGGPAPWLMLLALVGSIGLAVRQRALRAIDRRYFRDRVQGEVVVADVIRGCRQARTVAQLDHLIGAELDRALHVPRTTLFLLDGSRESYRATDDRMPVLPRSSIVTDLLGRGETIDLTAARSADVRAGWPTIDRSWVDAVGAGALVPLLGAPGDLLGFLAVGLKQSELPFDAHDRSLLDVLGAAVSPSVERYVRVAGAADVGRAAQECLACRVLATDGTDRCDRCGERLVEANVPVLLSQKYRITSRLGSGGMGVVYRATDESLGREVVVKTLPPVGDVLAPRLRREARAMASVSHPNLATLFGLETWRGRPFLVVEFLADGTLADRLGRGPVSVADALSIGVQLSAGLIHLHEAGILHRDIKPSNIGFARDGRPKLLDFGLAKLNALAGSGDMTRDSVDSTASGAVMGTIPYLSPEAALGGRPDESFDVWSLAVTLFESMAGENPFMAKTPHGVLTRIAAGPVPNLRAWVQGCPERLALLFDQLLAADPRDRLRSAVVLRDRLQAVLTEGESTRAT